MSEQAYGMIEVLENDQHLYHTVRQAMANRLRYGMGYPVMNADDYVSMVAHDGEDTVARDVSDAVSEAIQDLLIVRLRGDMFMPDDPTANLIASMFDFNNRDLWSRVTERFLPESAEDYDEMMSDYGF